MSKQDKKFEEIDDRYISIHTHNALKDRMETFGVIEHIKLL